MGAQLGGALTASLTPAIAKLYGWNSAFHVAAALSVLGALMWLLVDPSRKLVPAQVLDPAKDRSRNSPALPDSRV
jgi:cyanate permease